GELEMGKWVRADRRAGEAAQAGKEWLREAAVARRWGHCDVLLCGGAARGEAVARGSIDQLILTRTAQLKLPFLQLAAGVAGDHLHLSAARGGRRSETHPRAVLRGDAHIGRVHHCELPLLIGVVVASPRDSRGGVA